MQVTIIFFNFKLQLNLFKLLGIKILRIFQRKCSRIKTRKSQNQKTHNLLLFRRQVYSNCWAKDG